MENESSNQTETTETTQETNVETQQPDSQSVEQADTTSTEVSSSDSMAISEPSEPENSEVTMSIDDIVNEAMQGELSEETLEIIKEKGLENHIGAIVEGHKARIEKNNQELFSLVGGKDSYTELQEWGRNNISAEEREAFNAALKSNNINLAKLAVQGLKARYVEANGKAPERIIEGGGSANADNRPYSSVNEYLNETRSIKYKRDPEYRAMVESKRSKSGF